MWNTAVYIVQSCDIFCILSNCLQNEAYRSCSVMIYFITVIVICWSNIAFMQLCVNIASVLLFYFSILIYFNVMFSVFYMNCQVENFDIDMSCAQLCIPSITNISYVYKRRQETTKSQCALHEKPFMLIAIVMLHIFSVLTNVHVVETFK